MHVKLGTVGHFGLAVRDPERCARWWAKSFDLEEILSFRRRHRDQQTTRSRSRCRKASRIRDVFEHMSFHVNDLRTLRAACEIPQKNGVEMEFPGDEIGPEAPGSPHVGLWFHDPDGSRWELSVQNRTTEDN